MPSSGVQTCALDRKSTRLNSSHTIISYAVFCLKKNRHQELRVHAGLRGSRAPQPPPAPDQARAPRPPRPVRELTAVLFFLIIGQPLRPPPFPSATLFG